MPGHLDTLTILVPESRELDLFVSMLEAEGAVALRCPLVRIVDLDDTTEVDAWIDGFIQSPFDDLILLTGEGLRRLIALSDRGGRKADFVAAVAKTRTVTRGPKPARALREIGLEPGITAPAPTSRGVLDALAGLALQGRRIGVQLYPGDGGLPLVAALRERGAEVIPVTPYGYVSQEGSQKVADSIRALADGRIAMVAFTSSPQIERMNAVAREFGLERELFEGLKRAKIASIGPVVTQTLAAQGITGVIQPEASFHLKPLIRAIAAAWSAQRA
ncbi:MAG: uroporphyrinogen-III synthase [Beijerinckiaceae bacterium]|nr:uroporphyrinogen-III synthase [Beijerinckiaceae bacterium]